MYYMLNFKTGKYVVEVLEEQTDGTLVQVLAVLRHPKQGDLHHPKDVNVFFHERKALAYKEKRVVHPNLLKPYEETLPSYSDSLKLAVASLEDSLLQEDSSYNKQSLKNIEQLKQEYARDYKIIF